MTEKPLEAEAEEHHADDDTVSDETGTAYDPTGQADATPQDELPTEDEE